VELQLGQARRRPWQPLQLAGENGSSGHGEEGFDAGERERLLNANIDAIRPRVPLDDPSDAERAAADVAFKPNCLGIQTSIQEHSTNAESGPKVQTKDEFSAQSLSGSARVSRTRPRFHGGVYEQAGNRFQNLSDKFASSQPPQRNKIFSPCLLQHT
jgi:hypothetical protein